MPLKPTPSLDALRAQAQANFRYWHIYLMLRWREVEQHLSASDRQALPPLPLTTPESLDTHLLRTYGLLTGEEVLPTIAPLPTLAPLVADDFFYRVGVTLTTRGFLTACVSLDYVSVYAGQVAHLELLRVQPEDEASLQTAQTALQQMAHDHSHEIALQAARLWAVLQGAIPATNWQAVPNDALATFLPKDSSATAQVTPSLPPRKRGKGQFRDPH
jgi:hypothetical protein